MLYEGLLSFGFEEKILLVVIGVYFFPLYFGDGRGYYVGFGRVGDLVDFIGGYLKLTVARGVFFFGITIVVFLAFFITMR